MAASVAELANARGVRECLHWFTREKQWINEQHLALCRIPAPTFLEEKRAEWMAAQFRSLGCEARLDRGGNVVATLSPVREGPFVVISAHLDTVLAPRSAEEISLGAGGRFLGPGVADNGAGLAALLAIAAAMKASAPIEDIAYPVVFVANVGEEGEGNLSGMRFLAKRSPLGSKIAAFLVLDGPSTDHITCEALASRRFEVSYTGPGGHSWNDYGIANPVHAISRAVALFIEHRVNGRPAGARYSYNFGTIEGGTSINSIPTLARAKLDIRSQSLDRIEELSSVLTGSVERARDIENERAVGGKVTAKIREIGSRPGGRLKEGAKILSFVRAVDSFLNIHSHLDCASTDANIPLSMGLPAISIGAGGQGGGAHTPAEWFHPDGRDVALKRVLLTLVLLMLDPEAAPPAR